MALKSLYEEVVSITTNYLGPAADRFIDRQIKNHLNKEPHQLVKRDMRKLIDWLEPAMSLISDNPDLVAEYVRLLENLGSGRKEQNKYANHGR